MSVNTKVNGQLVKSAGLYSVTAPIGMADIYSTEEKEVGVFTDGKPIYSKTVTATSDVATGDGSWADISGAMSPTISNAETLVDAQIHGTVNIDYSMLRFCIVDGVIKCASKVTGNGWYTGLKVTFFYTKTTDTPWSGKFVPQGYGYVSSGDIYSFEERRIGVWTDGKPLYQKTVDFGALPNNTTKQVAHNVANLDKIAYIDGIINYSGLIYGEDMPPVILSKSFRTAVRENVVEISTTDNLSSYGAIVTFQYTKTTDVAGSGEYVPSGDKAVHYSTDEQVIGTWIDGKTLYRTVKEIAFSSLSTDGDQRIYDYRNDFPNCDIKKISGYSISATYGICNLGARSYKQNTQNSPYYEFSQYYGFPTLRSSQGLSDINTSIKPDLVLTFEYTKTS